MRVSRGAILTRRTPAAVRITFPVGLVGYPGERTFRLVPDPESREFAMLEEEPRPSEEPLRFGVLDPRGVVGGYGVVPTPEEREHLALASTERASVLVVLDLAPAPQETGLHLAAPILWNRRSGIGRQVVRANDEAMTVGDLLEARGVTKEGTA